jgi:hypothetical protein
MKVYEKQVDNCRELLAKLIKLKDLPVTALKEKPHH